MLERLMPVILLTVSNVFMTFAWYDHLKYKANSMWIVVLASWASPFSNIAFRFPPTVWDTRFIRPPN